MRINEVITESLDEAILDEWSTMDYGVIEALKKKGYKFLGKGVDQAAFREPGTGHVLKIFGTQGRQDFSKDHRMFFKWADYCQHHQDNEFLPRFYGHESFIWSREPEYKFQHVPKPARYLMIRTEPLRDSGEVGNWVSSLASYVNKNRDLGRAMELFDTDKSNSQPLYNHLGSTERIHRLAETIYDLNKFGRAYRWGWDLHHGNIMLRRDGTPVLNDPWVVD